jgi:hypothetical protein
MRTKKRKSKKRANSLPRKSGPGDCPVKTAGPFVKHLRSRPRIGPSYQTSRREMRSLRQRQTRRVKPFSQVRCRLRLSAMRTRSSRPNPLDLSATLESAWSFLWPAPRSGLCTAHHVSWGRRSGGRTVCRSPQSAECLVLDANGCELPSAKRGSDGR